MINSFEGGSGRGEFQEKKTENSPKYRKRQMGRCLSVLVFFLYSVQIFVSGSGRVCGDVLRRIEAQTASTGFGEVVCERIKVKENKKKAKADRQFGCVGMY